MFSALAPILALAALLAVLALVSALVLVPDPALAHPHVFVDSDLEVVFDAEGLAGFRQTWTFDEMFSVLILEDHDQEADGALSRDESEAVRQEAFDNTKQWNYFTHIAINGQNFPVQWVTEFSARVVKGRLQYQFFTPCHVAASGAKKVTVAVFDPDYYADFLPPYLDDVAVSGGREFKVALDQYQDPGAVFSQWMITPTLLEVRFSAP